MGEHTAILGLQKYTVEGEKTETNMESPSTASWPADPAASRGAWTSAIQLPMRNADSSLIRFLPPLAQNVDEAACFTTAYKMKSLGGKQCEICSDKNHSTHGELVMTKLGGK